MRTHRAARLRARLELEGDGRELHRVVSPRGHPRRHAAAARAGDRHLRGRHRRRPSTRSCTTRRSSRSPIPGVFAATAGLSDAQRAEFVVGAVFPFQLFSVQQDSLVWYRIEPRAIRPLRAARSTRAFRRTPRSARLRGAARASCRSYLDAIHRQDIAACDGVWQGLAQPLRRARSAFASREGDRAVQAASCSHAWRRHEALGCGRLDRRRDPVGRVPAESRRTAGRRRSQLPGDERGRRGAHLLGVVAIGFWPFVVLEATWSLVAVGWRGCDVAG